MIDLPDRLPIAADADFCIVGTVDPASGAIKVRDTKEPIGNSHAIDETGGVYIVTDAALYRFQAGSDGAPVVSWRTPPYENIGVIKPGQTERRRNWGVRWKIRCFLQARQAMSRETTARSMEQLLADAAPQWKLRKT